MCRYKSGAGPHVTRNCCATDDLVADSVIDWATRPDALALVSPEMPEIDVGQLRTTEAALVESRKQFALDHVDELITRDVMLAAITRIDKKLVLVRSELAAAMPVSSSLAGLVASVDVRATWEGWSLDKQRTVVRELFDITVLPVRRGRGFDPEAIRVIERELTP